jgi:hypothetical protein
VTRTRGEEVTLEQGERIMQTKVMRCGDVVAYVQVNPKTRARSYNHSAIYTGFDGKQHRITRRMISRFQSFFYDDSWNIYSERW